MSRIFISYRREDSQDVTGRICDRLGTTMPAQDIFRDVDSIAPGMDFRTAIEEALAKCEVVLVVIGPRWLDVVDRDGQSRLHLPGDPVRLEVEIALRRGIPIIPVTVSDARLPDADQLPETIEDIVFRNACQVRPDPDFHRDVDRLITAVRAAAAERPSTMTARTMAASVQGYEFRKTIVRDELFLVERQGTGDLAEVLVVTDIAGEDRPRDAPTEGSGGGSRGRRRPRRRAGRRSGGPKARRPWRAGARGHAATARTREGTRSRATRVARGAERRGSGDGDLRRAGDRDEGEVAEPVRAGREDRGQAGEPAGARLDSGVRIPDSLVRFSAIPGRGGPHPSRRRAAPLRAATTAA